MGWLLFAPFLVLFGCGRVGFDGSRGDSRLNDDAGESQYAEEVRRDAPLAYWRFGEASGTVAHDEIGGNDGLILGGVTRAPGPTNDGDLAVRFDGMSGRIEVGDIFRFAGNAPYTVELWAMRDTVDSKVRWMIDRTSDGTPHEGWQIYTGADFTLHSRSTNDVEVGYAGTDQFDDGQWRYLVATYDGDEASFYRDGEFTGGMISPDPIGGPSGLLVFGDTTQGQFYKFDGVLDDIAIYDYALSVTQVRAHFTASGR